MAGKYDRVAASAGNLFKVTGGLLETPPEVVEREIVVPDPNSIVPQADGRLIYKRFTMTSTGLQIPADVTIEEFKDFGGIVSGLQTKLQWVLGDWVNGYMDKVFEDRKEALSDQEKSEAYEAIATEYNLEAKTVKEYSYIARSVDASIRMDALSFGHHQLVAPKKYTRDDKYNWLMWAVQVNASVADMRKKMRGTTPTPPTILERFERDFTAYRKALKGMGQGERDELRKLAEDLISQIIQMG